MPPKKKGGKKKKGKKKDGEILFSLATAHDVLTDKFRCLGVIRSSDYDIIESFRIWFLHALAPRRWRG